MEVTVANTVVGTGTEIVNVVVCWVTGSWLVVIEIVVALGV